MMDTQISQKSIANRIHSMHHRCQPTIWTATESAMHKTMTLMAMDYPTQQNKIQLRLLSSTMLILMVTESAMGHLLQLSLRAFVLQVLMLSQTIQPLGWIPMAMAILTNLLMVLLPIWFLTRTTTMMDGRTKVNLRVEPIRRMS